MSNREFTLTVVDNGSHVTLLLSLYETIGTTQVGPHRLLTDSILSFPEADKTQWVKDMLVHTIEHL